MTSSEKEKKFYTCEKRRGWGCQGKLKTEIRNNKNVIIYC